MFFHTKQFQYNATPDRPDPLYAKKLQEVLGGQFGEMSVMMQYLFQGWNCRGPAKYKDMLLAIGTEEMAHVEMLSAMISQLLNGASLSDQESAARNPAVGAVMGGTDVQSAVLDAMNPQHLIVSGAGAAPNDSVGFPWTARYIIASGNLLADFRANLNAESQGRLQVARLFHMTQDAGVRDMLSFMLARDTMHQNQWIAAITELESSGLEMTPVPSSFPLEWEKRDVAYQFWNCTDGIASSEGRWASGPSPDGKGEFEFLEDPEPLGNMVELSEADPMLHGTGKVPVQMSVEMGHAMPDGRRNS
jgi:Mn-containing catalase